jgi:hypothetical protein
LKFSIERVPFFATEDKEAHSFKVFLFFCLAPITRVIHVDPRAFKHLLIITSASHMPRTKAIFQWVYGLKSPFGQNDYTLTFEEVPDRGMDEELLQLRIKKEKKGLENVLRLKETIRTFENFHQWLFTEHGAYSVSVPPERAKGKILHAY